MNVGLEVRKEWWEQIITGKKKLESRRYPLPQFLLDKEVWVLCTEGSIAGVSLLPDDVPRGSKCVVIVGSIVFSSCSQYTCKETWDSDRHLHCVEPTSPYDWDGHGEMFRWSIRNATPVSCKKDVPRMVRLHRSLFLLHDN